MKTTRQGVFETNSSSTHSLCLCTKEEFDKFKKGELYFNSRAEELMTFDEGVKFLREDYEDDSITDLDDDAFYTFESLESGCDMTTQRMTTKNGDEVVAFCAEVGC